MDKNGIEMEEKEMMKSNKIFRLAAVLGMSALMLTACGDAGSAKIGGNGAGASGEGVSGVTLKLSHGLSEEHPIQAALEQFADEVKESTDGAITVEIYPNATLGSEKDNLEQMPIGALDMAKVSAASLETFAPVYEAFSVPYIFDNKDHYYAFMDSEEAEEVYKSTSDDGFIALTWFDSGARSFYTVDTPINTPEDLKGLKIRTMDSPLAFEMMDCFGGSATTMSISDVYTAMQSGVIDGAENNETALATGGHGEIAKCYSYDMHTQIPDILVIATSIWNSMSEDQQKAVKTAADNAKEAYKVAWNEAIDESVAAAEEMGVTFYTPDLTPFQEAVQPIYDRLASEEPDVWAVCEKIQNYEY